MSQNLLVATTNLGKIREYAEMLAVHEVRWLSPSDLQLDLDVQENGQTFQENAILKATAYAKEARVLTLADDSGLEVDWLGGAPGVYTARYGGPGLTYAERYSLLLAEMRNVPWEQRTARFRCVIAMAGSDGRLLATTEGVCSGVIALEPTGEGGFGYDPVFFLPEKGLTMAQLDASEKHAISHRGQALRALKPLLWRALFSDTT